MTTSTQQDKLLLPEEAAEFLKFSVDTLANWRCNGGGPPFKRIGRSIRYSLIELQKWVDSQSAD